MRNGNVEILVEGPEFAVDRLIAWCHRGPTSAYVSKVRVEKSEATNKFDGFAVKRTL